MGAERIFFLIDTTIGIYRFTDFGFVCFIFYIVCLWFVLLKLIITIQHKQYNLQFIQYSFSFRFVGVCLDKVFPSAFPAIMTP